MNRVGYYISIALIVIGIILILVAVWLYPSSMEEPDDDLFDSCDEYREAYRDYLRNSHASANCLLSFMFGSIFLIIGLILYIAGSDAGKRWSRYLI